MDVMFKTNQNRTILHLTPQKSLNGLSLLRISHSKRKTRQLYPARGGTMWRKPMSKQHKPPKAVARSSGLFGTGLSPEIVLIIMIATKSK